MINHSAAQVTGLVLTDRYDDGFVHAAATNPIQRELGTLPPNQSQKIAITFKVVKPGRLCHTIEMTGAGGLHESTQACVQADALPVVAPPAAPPVSPPVAPPIVPPVVPPAAPPTGPASPPIVVPPAKPAATVKITGPQSATVGQTATFVIEATNTGSVVIPTLRISEAYDQQTLRAVQATDGFSVAGGQLVWTVQNLAPGQTVRRTIVCNCIAAAPRTCNQATASDGAELTSADQACIAILAADASGAAAAPATSAPIAGSNLHIQIAGPGSSVKAGTDASYQITLSNDARERRAESGSFDHPSRRHAILGQPASEFSQIDDRRPDYPLRANRRTAAERDAHVRGPRPSQCCRRCNHSGQRHQSESHDALDGRRGDENSVDGSR